MDKQMADKLHEARDIDLSGAARGVWLVKVPKYLSEKWKKSGPSNEVGKLRISKAKVAGGKPEVLFSLNEQLAIQNDETDIAKVPRDHKFVLTGMATQSLSVLSQEPTDLPPAAGPEEYSEKIAVEGKIIQRAECRPINSDSYMNLNRTRMELSNQPKRQLVALNKAVVNYKPKSAHKFNIDADRKKKEGGQRVRMEKEKVQESLFSAFEKHQYYNVKDLVRITEQPVTYLKEILKEICNYNMKAPHKNMWELKPEYRHYKTDT